MIKNSKLTTLAVTAALCFIALSCQSQQKQETMEQLTERVFRVAAQQYVYLDTELDSIAAIKGASVFPKTYEKVGGASSASLVTTDLKWWCSGFPAGTYWYIYEGTKDSVILNLAIKHTAKMAGILAYPTHHDIGFQVNDSYGHAYRILGDPAYLPLIQESAERLAARFNPVCGVTKSWDTAEGSQWKYPVIIDNMMNLELLINASKLFDKPELAQIAKAHANTTMKNHFRDDYSVFHLLDYSPETGEVLKKQTVQGYANQTCWGRGEAWALYGFTMMYRETGEQTYLTHAEHIADYLLSMLPEDGIPYWDFNCPGTPCCIPDSCLTNIPSTYNWKEGDPVLRDASAGAVMASAFVDLSRLAQDSPRSGEYLAQAEKMLRTLASDEYLAKPGENGGFILKHSVGNLHAARKGPTEVDVPLTYADYYFLEAILKYDNPPTF